MGLGRGSGEAAAGSLDLRAGFSEGRKPAPAFRGCEERQLLRGRVGTQAVCGKPRHAQLLRLKLAPRRSQDRQVYSSSPCRGRWILGAQEQPMEESYGEVVTEVISRSGHVWISNSYPAGLSWKICPECSILQCDD
ncbi:zinc finger protein 32 isoform X4 [Callithrix jacchus]